MMMVSLEDHSVESTWLITLVDESAKWAIPFLIGLQAKENTNCNSPQFRLFAAATADSHRCPGNTPTWWMHLCFTSFAIILICALRSQQLYLNCRNPTMLHFQWESREIRIQFQLSERDSCLGMNFAVCTESRQATAVHGMTTSVQRTAQKTITS